MADPTAPDFGPDTAEDPLGSADPPELGSEPEQRPIDVDRVDRPGSIRRGNLPTITSPDAATPGGLAPVSERATTDVQPSSARIILLARIGHDNDPDSLLDLMLEAERQFERGDNRRASELIRRLLERRPSAQLREIGLELRRRIRPDRFAIIVLAVCVVALVLVWLLAVSANRSF